jgi:hypothetical protein
MLNVMRFSLAAVNRAVSGDDACCSAACYKPAGAAAASQLYLKAQYDRQDFVPAVFRWALLVCILIHTAACCLLLCRQLPQRIGSANSSSHAAAVRNSNGACVRQTRCSSLATLAGCRQQRHQTQLPNTVLVLCC